MTRGGLSKRKANEEKEAAALITSLQSNVLVLSKGKPLAQYADVPELSMHKICIFCGGVHFYVSGVTCRYEGFMAWPGTSWAGPATSWATHDTFWTVLTRKPAEFFQNLRRSMTYGYWSITHVQVTCDMLENRDD